MKNKITLGIKKILGAWAILGVSAIVNAAGYQELTPTAVYSGSNGELYIVTATNIGANGCTHNKNSVVINPDEQSADLVKSALSITLTAISSSKSINVYWNGCLTGGRPKATLVGLGTTEIN